MQTQDGPGNSHSHCSSNTEHWDSTPESKPGHVHTLTPPPRSARPTSAGSTQLLAFSINMGLGSTRDEFHKTQRVQGELSVQTH